MKGYMSSCVPSFNSLTQFHTSFPKNIQHFSLFPERYKTFEFFNSRIIIWGHISDSMSNFSMIGCVLDTFPGGRMGWS